MTPRVKALRNARALYASAPSHAPDPEWPKPGTYCFLSAIEKASLEVYKVSPWKGGSNKLVELARRAVADLWGHGRLLDFNAEHSTDEVLVAFDRTIELAEAEAE
jgi:hypothetical protein